MKTLLLIASLLILSSCAGNDYVARLDNLEKMANENRHGIHIMGRLSIENRRILEAMLNGVEDDKTYY